MNKCVARPENHTSAEGDAKLNVCFTCKLDKLHAVACFRVEEEGQSKPAAVMLTLTTPNQVNSPAELREVSGAKKKLSFLKKWLVHRNCVQ